MDPVHRDAIVRRPDEEGARSAFPGGFPDSIAVPAARYCDPEFASLERAHIFEKCWLFVAHAEQLPGAGSYLLLDALDRIGHPIFLLRGEDDRIRAFYNSCRHRGGPLVNEPNGVTGKRLVCKYHSWTYDLEGKLLGFPEAKNFPRGMKGSCPPLARAQCDTWGPLVFVKLAPGGPGLREYLEPVASELDPLLGRAASVHFAGVKQLDVECNWKLAGDGNIETYHVPFVHRNTAAAVLDEKRTGQWLFPNGHSRMLIRFRESVLDAVAASPIPPFEGDTSLAALGIYSFHVFPNLSIVMGGPSSAFLISAIPDGPHRCAYYTHFLSPVARNPENTRLLDASIAANWTVLLEDLACMSSAQKAMRSGVADVLRLQYQERRIRYVHEEIDRRIGPERIPLSLRTPALLDDYVEAG
jgi:phenylpropionate dioxygenase-like ring-hydroxylating dioxygenase large terminal subunit